MASSLQAGDWVLTSKRSPAGRLSSCHSTRGAKPEENWNGNFDYWIRLTVSPAGKEEHSNLRSRAISSFSYWSVEVTMPSFKKKL